jgi:hypothetical protein
MQRRAFFRVVAAVEIGGKKPTQVFQLPVSEDGAPVEKYWRKRIDDGSVAPHEADAPSEPPAPSASPSAASSPASEAARKLKKGS